MDIREKFRLEKNLYVLPICVILVLIGVAFAVSSCFRDIQVHLEEHVAISLEDVTTQNVSTLQAQIESKKGRMEDKARVLPYDTEGIREEMLRMEEVKDLYGYKRVGYVEMDGHLVTSDGYDTVFPEMHWFEPVFQGRAVITGTVTDDLDGTDEDINVLMMPVYEQDEKSVRGVLFASYRTQIFGDMLAMESYEEAGVSCIALPDGSVMVGAEHIHMTKHDNLFDALAAMDESNREVAAQLRADFAAGESGFIRYVDDSGDRYMFYMPVSVLSDSDQWYLGTIAPAEVFDSRLNPISERVQWLVTMVVISFLACIVICFIVYWKHHMREITMAYTDLLTGGDNYTAFRAKMRTKKDVGWIVSLDLAEFKLINNTCGIKMGDELIVEIWKIVDDMVVTDELAGHINGDDFVLFLKGDLDAVIRRLETCRDRICALSDKLSIPHIVPKFGIYEKVDMGHPEDGYGKANLAKKSIRSRRDAFYAVYDESIIEKEKRDQQMENDLDEAIETGQFQVWYQPKYEPKHHRLVGAEALVRWKNEKGEMIRPGDFIPLFEQNGQIFRIDEYVFRTMCRTQKRWGDAGLLQLPISVNLSRASLYHQDVVQHYLEIVEEVGIDISVVQLEITESAAVNNKEIRSLTARFREAGFSMLVDDFGSGFSSLAILNMGCFNGIKIDKELIDAIGEPNGDKLLAHVIALARSLGLSVTAEGVEEKRQVEFLIEQQCDDIQGYYYSRPIPEAEYEKLLRESISL